MNDDLCLVFLLSEDTEHDLEHAPEQLLRFGMPPPTISASREGVTDQNPVLIGGQRDSSFEYPPQ